MTQLAIHTQRLTKRYGGVTAVDNVNLAIEHGGVYGLLGPNGAGKTSLLKMLLGMVLPSEGEGYLFGRKMDDTTGEVRQRVSFVLEPQTMYPDLKADELIRLCAGLYPAWDDERCRKLKQIFALPWNRRIRSFSKGMKTQVALLIALSSRPRLLIADELTSALDPIVRQTCLQLVMQEVASGDTTVLFATHQVHEIERMADHVGFLFNGRLIVDRSLDVLKTSSRMIQAVFLAGVPAEVRQMEDVIRIQEEGKFCTITVSGKWEDCLERVKAAQPAHVDVMDVGLEELFIHVAQKEGYRYEPLHLD
ncbi:UNVERIFIED_CONTAM: ABC-2 type transport system ATP-binding protein [Brevibacillus sp. OAP136]